jgi:hypothetical protein
MGTSAVINTTERYRAYTSLSSVAGDFGTSSVEYRAAQAWFSQAPQPTQLLIGRWINTAASGGLVGATLSSAAQAIALWQAVTAGSFKISKNGVAGVDVTGLNFSGAANLNAVAALIQAAANMSGTTVVWNASFQRFEIQSTTTGPTSAIGFLTAAATGTDISAMLGMTAATSGAYLYAGAAAETAIAATALMDDLLGQQWYGLNFPSISVNADHLAVAGYVEGAETKHTYWVTTQEAGTLNASSTSDLAYLMSQANLRRSFVQYSSSSAVAVLSAAARILTTDYSAANTVITLKFKNEPGIVAEFLNETQANALEAKGCNVFVNYNNNTQILEQGVMSDGTYADVVTGTDWLAIEIQNELYNVLYQSPTKIPQTDAGQQILLTTCEAVCSQGVTNGLLAPGVWDSQGFGLLTQGDFLDKGFYVYSASFTEQNAANRGARKAMPIQIAAKLAGAIHSIDVAITVNQ